MPIRVSPPSLSWRNPRETDLSSSATSRLEPSVATSGLAAAPHALPAISTPNAASTSLARTPSLTSERLGTSVHVTTGIPVALLDRWLRDANRLLNACRAHPPKNLDDLRLSYERLGEATAMCEAAMRSCLDALDERTIGERANGVADFKRLLHSAFETLRQTGTAFAALSADFSTLVHGPSSWPARPVELLANRGDGRALVGYENTFKSATPLTKDERADAFQQRVEKFVSRGGNFDDILVAQPETFGALPSGVHHDYVLLPDGTLRLFENAKDDDQGPPKPGHSLLATGSARFRDEPVLLAGELWVLKDSAGDVEAVVIANNSGHYKPSFEDLENALPHLARLGIPRERVVLFGGPNNLDAIFREIGERQPQEPRGRVTRMEDIFRRAEESLMPSPLALRIAEG